MHDLLWGGLNFFPIPPNNMLANTYWVLKIFCVLNAIYIYVLQFSRQSSAIGLLLFSFLFYEWGHRGKERFGHFSKITQLELEPMHPGSGLWSPIYCLTESPHREKVKHWFIQQMFTERLYCARHHSRVFKHSYSYVFFFFLILLILLLWMA